MSDQKQPEASNEGTPAPLSATEQASVEKGQNGLSDVNVAPPPPSGPQRPEYVPEQFFKDGKVDIESLAKSYAELRSKMDGKQPEQQQQQEQPNAEAPKVGADGKIEKPEVKQEEQAQPAPLATAMEAARTEWAEKQEVSEETVTALEAAGIPREVFNLYIEGVKAQTAATLSSIHSYTDGAENYTAMATWAAQHCTDKELDAFNEALDNPELRENAVRGLYARYTAARPSEGKLITPAGTPSQAGDVYTSRDQLIADQRDPRYGTDASFRQGVMDKLARSQKQGFSVVKRSIFEKQVLST